MNINARILEAREQRYFRIKALSERQKTLVIIKANTPGRQKAQPLACFLVKLFAKQLTTADFWVIGDYLDEDGYYKIFGSNKDPNIVKQKTIDIEEKHPLGRFIDIDVYDEHHKLSRTKPRRCFVCGEIATSCIRNNRHHPELVLKAFVDPIATHLERLIVKLIEESVLDELNLEPKFGLVSKSTSGSHKDMDYDLMLKAHKAIEADLYRIFLMGFNAKTTQNLFEKIRAIGIEAETKMLRATAGINTYKGLIFSLGIVLAACGYLLSGKRKEQDVFEVAKEIVGNITAELDKESRTFGERAYKRYGFKGARGEAESGFENVKNVYEKLEDLSWHSRMLALISLISSVDDTVFLKRSGSFEKYKEHQAQFYKIERVDVETVASLTDYCISHDLSFGGSADLLVVACFLRRLHDEVAL